MGFNNHTSGFSDEFLAMALLHAELSKSLRAELFWRGQYNFENGDMVPGNFYSGLYQNGAAWMMAGGDLFCETPFGFGISAGCSVPLRGQLIVAAPVFRVGINALLTKKPAKSASNPDEKTMK
jgi:hypothetical protein